MVFREVASVIIYNPISKKICIQNRTTISKYGEKVDLFGGGLEAGETPEDAIKRESDEELGLVFSNYQYLGKFVYDMGTRDYVRHLFIVSTDQEKFTDKEGDGAFRASIAEAKTQHFISDMVPEFEAIEKYIRERK